MEKGKVIVAGGPLTMESDEAHSEEERGCSRLDEGLDPCLWAPKRVQGQK